MPGPGSRPEPPLAQGVGLPWDVEVTDAVAVLADARATYGDTFWVESGRDRYLFTFSGTGVDSFYALAEDDASKGVADYLMLRRKLPDEIFDGRRTLPGSLFRRGDVASYLDNLEQALDATVVELGAAGRVDVFALTRRIGHRMGLASWGSPGAADGPELEELVAAFDVLDGAEAFVHPDAMAEVAASGKADERAALARIVEIIGPASDALDPATAASRALFRRIVDAWADEPADVRRQGVAYDVTLIHIASMSNLGAALAWALVDLLEHRDVAEQALAGDTDLLARCCLESTRLAQRSIMARTVLRPVRLDVGTTTYDVGPGATIATLLPLTNASPELGHDTWDPDRWARSRFVDTAGLASTSLVTAFGVGRHTCPAQPFSISAMSTALTRLFGAFDLRAAWSEHPRPVPAQIGGVARAAEAVLLDYRRHVLGSPRTAERGAR